jgi:hypothetical protein
MTDTELSKSAALERVRLELSTSGLIGKSEGLWICVGHGVEHLLDELDGVIDGLELEAEVAVLGAYSHDHVEGAAMTAVDPSV